ncbi:hypothetical protein COO60DRAFT_391875 [Scenedesmus sp. NREL 46B-D3]|nr:hypothetical protein COO60DRAFT_391875 [Scenedesmus sp. NREL 46B-D3]
MATTQRPGSCCSLPWQRCVWAHTRPSSGGRSRARQCPTRHPHSSTCSNWHPPQQQQQQQQQHRLQLRTHAAPQQQQQQVLDDLRSPSPRPAYSGIFHPSASAAHSRSRSRSPSPSSNSPGSSSDSDSDDVSSGSSRRLTRGSSVRWGSTASSSTSSSSARTGTSAHVTTSTAAATAAQAQADSKHIAQAEQASVEQEQLEAMTLQLISVGAGSDALAYQAAAGQGCVTGQLPAAGAAAAAAAGQAPAGPPPLWLARFCAGWVHASLGTVAVSLLEKQKRWAEAVELLRLLLGGNGCVARRGDWWERLAINLEHQGLAEQALEVRRAQQQQQQRAGRAAQHAAANGCMSDKWPAVRGWHACSGSACSKTSTVDAHQQVDGALVIVARRPRPSDAAFETTCYDDWTPTGVSLRAAA